MAKKGQIFDPGSGKKQEIPVKPPIKPPVKPPVKPPPAAPDKQPAKVAGALKTIEDFENQFGKSFNAITADDIGQFSVGKGVFPQLATSLAFLEVAKKQVQAGNLTIGDYLTLANPVAELATGTLNFATTGGSADATRAKAFLPQLRKFTRLSSTTGQGSFETAIAPFTEREAAQLPDNVLPTQEDVNSGLIGSDLLPPNIRLRPEPTPEEPTAPGEVAPGEEVPSETPSITEPGGFPIGTDIPVGLTEDQLTIEREAIRQQGQSELVLEAQSQERERRLADLADLLGREGERQFGIDRPLIAEGAQEAGLLRSSGFGEALARRNTDLQGQIAFQLAQQGLADREADIGGVGDILRGRQGFQAGGLERRFSLEDFERQAQLARELGATSAPGVPQSGKGGTTQNVLGGAALGATIGSGGGAIGSGIGAGTGALAGLIGGK